MPFINPRGITFGHYECRNLDESLAVLSDLFACEIIDRQEKNAQVKHPNTSTSLIVHELNESIPDKPHANHYGFRVAHHKEIEAAAKYLSENKGKYRLKSIVGPQASHFAYSVYLEEPGGNTLELEYYNPNAATHGRRIASGHWNNLLSDPDFSSKGFMPQAMSHGTLECDNPEISNKFYTEVLGLEVVGGGNISTYIGLSSQPWYIVVLPATLRVHLRPTNRYVIKLGSRVEVIEAYNQLSADPKGISQLSEVFADDKAPWFLLSDPDKIWWEITSSSLPNFS